jgi:hypothetical protein
VAVGEVIQPGDGKGPAMRRRWGRASGRRERERGMGRGQPLDGAREAGRRERGDGKGRAVVSLKMIAWLREWGGSREGRRRGRGR